MSDVDVTAGRSVQYRVIVGKGDERVEGPDGADVVFTVPLADAGLDPTVAFMQGRLKATGHSGSVLALLKSGAVAEALSRLASPS